MSLTHRGTCRLRTERLELRQFTMDDAEAMFRNWESDERVTRFLRWPAATSLSETYEVLGTWTSSYDDPSFYQWAIVPVALGEPIGSISVVELDEKVCQAEVGYCIGVPWWHQGYTSEALCAIVDFLFDEVGALRVQAKHDPRNPNSGRVMRSCGMRYEGTLRGADWNNQGIVDVCMYGLLASDR